MVYLQLISSVDAQHRPVGISSSWLCLIVTINILFCSNVQQRKLLNQSLLCFWLFLFLSSFCDSSAQISSITHRPGLYETVLSLSQTRLLLFHSTNVSHLKVKATLFAVCQKIWVAQWKGNVSLQTLHPEFPLLVIVDKTLGHSERTQEGPNKEVMTHLHCRMVFTSCFLLRLRLISCWAVVCNFNTHKWVWEGFNLLNITCC